MTNDSHRAADFAEKHKINYHVSESPNLKEDIHTENANVKLQTKPYPGYKSRCPTGSGGPRPIQQAIKADAPQRVVGPRQYSRL